MTRRALCAVVVAGLLAPAFAATTPPMAQLRGGTLSVTLPAGLLSEREVRKQLNSGLTTTFVLVATLDDERKSGARVDIRFEPWDEVYFVTLRRMGAQPQKSRAASFAQLETWWRETSPPPSPATPRPRASASGSVLDLLIGTSIQRRPIVRHRWQVQVTR